MKGLSLLLSFSYALHRTVAFGGGSSEAFQRRKLADGDAYDVGGKAPICWATTKPGTVNATVTRLSSCPGEAAITFVESPPDMMYAGQRYHSVYRFALDPAAVNQYRWTVKGTKWDVPHANIHSCVSTVGFCTPFIANTPALATHTPALTGNILATGSGNIYSVDFKSEVLLNPGVYTIIAHARWFAANGTVQYDIASAIFRDVLPFVSVLTVTQEVQYAMLVFVAMGVVFLLAILLALLYYRKHKVMRASQVKILMAMAVAGLISVLSLPLYAWPTTLSCNLRPWLCVVPLNLMFGLLFGKTWRIWRLMNNKGFKALRITDNQVFGIAIGCCLVEIITYLVEGIAAPVRIGLESTVNSSTFIHHCNGRGRRLVTIIHLSYSALILAVGCIAANESSKLTTLFNEGKGIVLSIYTCAILGFIIVPASAAVSGDPSVSYILTVMGIVMSVCGTIGALNMPKLLVIRSGVEVSVSEHQQSISYSTTRSPVVSPTTSRSASMCETSPRALPPGSQSIGSSVPSKLFKAMGRARDALSRVTTRQDQGFAVVLADFEECIAEVDALHTMLIGYDKRAPPPNELQTALLGLRTHTPRDRDEEADEGSESDEEEGTANFNPIADKPSAKVGPSRVAIDNDPIIVGPSPKGPGGVAVGLKSIKVAPHG